MKQWVAKLGQGMARLAVWRKRGAAAAEAEATPAAAAETSPAATPAPAAVAPVPVAIEAAPPIPAIADAALADGLAELGDPTAPQANSIDSLFSDGLAELGDSNAPIQGETISADALYTDTSTGGLAELDFIPEPGDEPASTPAAEQVAPAQTVPDPAMPQAASEPDEANPATPDALAETSAPPPSTSTATAAPAAESDTDPAAISLVQRLKQRARGLLAVFGKKRVWIPSASLALLAVIGSLSFMLVKASSEKAHLQADLTAAKKALKQADAKPSVAVIPPLLAGPVPPADAQPEPQVDLAAEHKAEPHSPAEAHTPPPVVAAVAKPSPEPVHIASASSKRDPVQMDCDVSSKASVAQNLKKCIEAFNQATGH